MAHGFVLQWRRCLKSLVKKQKRTFSHFAVYSPPLLCIHQSWLVCREAAQDFENNCSNKHSSLFQETFLFPICSATQEIVKQNYFFFLNPQHLKTKRIKDSVNRNAFVSSLFPKCFNFFLLFWIFNNRFERCRTSIVCQRPSQTQPCLQISSHGHLLNAVERWGTSSSFEPVFSVPWENKTSVTLLWMPTPQGRLCADANPDSVTRGTQPAPAEPAVTFRSKPTYP